MELIRKALLISVLVTVAGCNPGPEPEVVVEAEDIEPIDFDLDAIIARGSLRVIIDNSSTGYFVYKGQPMGYEYDLLDRYAREIGVGLEFHLTTNLDQTFDLLNLGVGDIIAYSLTVTKGRKEKVAFTQSHIQARQMLIQRKPDNWRNLKRHEIEQGLIRNPNELIGKKVHVRLGSAYASRLANLSDELGDDIEVIEDFQEASTEEIIQMVADGNIDFTIADEHVAMVNATYHQNIDVKTPVSFPQNIAWAVRKNSPKLLESLNNWIDVMKKKPDYYVIFNKYFKNPKTHLARARSDYSNISGSKISPYDDLIIKAAQELGWDWKLLAAQVYQESNFNPRAKSWAGAVGLMQLVPRTGMAYGVTDLENPEKSIEAGTKHIKWLNRYWKEKVPDSLERVKFILASYNVGQGHVLDAYRLAEQNLEDSDNWETVSKFLLKKSEEKYYRDPVVKYGYCHCEEPVQYVENIFELYDHYSTLMATDSTAASS
ncbi:MAG: transporter substrate-binding domain-containing protein [Cyclobacteriaceae bacterium]